MKNLITVLFVISTLIFSCKSVKDTSSSISKKDLVKTTEKWIIASTQVTCDETSEVLCYQIKKPGAMDYEKLNVLIENFIFEPGYKYQIELSIIPSKKEGTRYEMLKQIHKVAVN